MDYEGIVSGLNKIGSVLSVQLKPDGSCGDICLEAANDTYLASVHVKREDFVPGRPYSDYVPASRNYEDMSYRCIRENRMVHSYINVGTYNAWMEVYMLPLRSEEADKGYYLFAYDMTPACDAEKLSDISPDIAIQVLQITVRLRESDDFLVGMHSVIKDIRASCEAERCCVLLTDFKNRSCSVLAKDATIEEDENVPLILPDNFIDIVESWDSLIAGSNCYIIHDSSEMELLKDTNRIWYDSLVHDGVYSLVIYPLKSNGETTGYIWAVNFNSDNTLRIKAILEVTAFLLAAETANHQLYQRLRILSNTDMLTGLYNRNAMNNRIQAIVSGTDPLNTPYGVIFADVNGLKLVNDTLGHNAGDELLKAAASILREVFDGHEIYRAGGDEFLILVTGCTGEEFGALTDRLVQRSDVSAQVKLAVGASMNTAETDIRNAMRLADERMYRDKEAFYRKHPEMKRDSRDQAAVQN